MCFKARDSIALLFAHYTQTHQNPDLHRIKCYVCWRSSIFHHIQRVIRNTTADGKLKTDPTANHLSLPAACLQAPNIVLFHWLCVPNLGHTKGATSMNYLRKLEKSHRK